jgi:sodium transport system ATP-binding protein
VNQTLIETQELVKIYPDHRGGEGVRAVDGVSFECRAGEIFGLLGLNGAGKTTTLRMLSTALTPTGGSARVNGYDVSREAQEVRRSIGFLSGTTGLYHRLTAQEMITLFGELHGLRGATLDARVRKVLVEFGVDRYADQRCEKLSTGMKQKVNIARTVVHDPPILILDEPTSGLDVLASSTTLEFIVRAKHEGKCVLFSTHIMSEAETLCDRIGILHQGKIRAMGTLEELRSTTGERDLQTIFRQIVQEDAA